MFKFINKLFNKDKDKEEILTDDYIDYSIRNYKLELINLQDYFDTKVKDKLRKDVIVKGNNFELGSIFSMSKLTVWTENEDGFIEIDYYPDTYNYNLGCHVGYSYIDGFIGDVCFVFAGNDENMMRILDFLSIKDDKYYKMYNKLPKIKEILTMIYVYKIIKKVYCSN